MPAERLPMRQVREVLRLKHAAGFSERQIAGALRISRSTVAEYVRRAAVVGIAWPVPAELDDAALEAKLFSPPFSAPESPRRQPDWPRLHAELRRSGVTLLLLWEEYRAGQPAGYGYSRFCDLDRDWRAGISPTMRQTHIAGERLFVDFAVQVVERWVLARLRHRRFFSLGELNAAIRELNDGLNGRSMRRIGCSRRALFEAIEQSSLLSLPSEPFEYAEWKRCRPGLDYHIGVHGHWYSVPHRLIREVVEARITDRTVEMPT